MSDIDQSEQWKLNGRCIICRRANYCSNKCTAHKRSTQMFVSSMIHQTLDEMSGGAYSEIMDRARRV